MFPESRHKISQWPLACWDCGFESRRGHGCLSLVSVMFCQVEVSASGWSLVQRSPTECDVSECVREASIMRWPWPTRGCCAIGRRKIFKFFFLILQSRDQFDSVRLQILSLWPLIPANTQLYNAIHRPTTFKAVYFPWESYCSATRWAHYWKNFKNFQTVAEIMESNKLVTYSNTVRQTRG
jgi:hypothetical protein